MPSPSTVYSVQDRHIDDDSERFAHDSSDLDGYFVVAPDRRWYFHSVANGLIDKAYSRLTDFSPSRCLE
jgi:hypothetical protein